MAAEPMARAALVGTYRLDPSSLHRQTVPTNFFAFALMLHQDGSFGATNVPADFFFDYSPTLAVAGVKGNWTIRHRSERGSLMWTGEQDWLELNFTSAPGSGSYQALIQANPWRPPRISMSYHGGKSDAASFYLKKENR